MLRIADDRYYEPNEDHEDANGRGKALHGQRPPKPCDDKTEPSERDRCPDPGQQRAVACEQISHSGTVVCVHGVLAAGGLAQKRHITARLRASFPGRPRTEPGPGCATSPKRSRRT